jgi:long-subunit acyl-CoA synthetase (AMP-forming)
MTRRNLLEFFRAYFDTDSEYLEYDNGFRRWTYSYSETGAAARMFAEHLRQLGIGKGDRVLLSSESRPEWIFAFRGRPNR